MSRQLDHWLARRAAGGDEHAFDSLIASHTPKLRAMAGEWCRGGDQEVDDAVQIITERLWRGILRGHWNGHVEFRVYAAKIGRQAMIDDHTRRRALKRWDPLGPPVSLDLVVDPDPESTVVYRFPSWALAADPAVVVLQRETLREAWQACTTGQMAAINAWLRCDGHGLPSNVTTAVAEARKRVRPILTPLRLV